MKMLDLPIVSSQLRLSWSLAQWSHNLSSSTSICCNNRSKHHEHTKIPKQQLCLQRFHAADSKCVPVQLHTYWEMSQMYQPSFLESNQWQLCSTLLLPIPSVQVQLEPIVAAADPYLQSDQLVQLTDNNADDMALTTSPATSHKSSTPMAFSTTIKKLHHLSQPPNKQILCNSKKQWSNQVSQHMKARQLLTISPNYLHTINSASMASGWFSASTRFTPALSAALLRATWFTGRSIHTNWALKKNPLSFSKVCDKLQMHAAWCWGAYIHTYIHMVLISLRWQEITLNSWCI